MVSAVAFIRQKRITVTGSRKVIKELNVTLCCPDVTGKSPQFLRWKVVTMLRERASYFQTQEGPTFLWKGRKVGAGGEEKPNP